MHAEVVVFLQKQSVSMRLNRNSTEKVVLKKQMEIIFLSSFWHPSLAYVTHGQDPVN